MLKFLSSVFRPGQTNAVRTISASSFRQDGATSLHKLIYGKTFVSIDHKESVQNAVLIMGKRQVGAVPVTKENKLVGIMTERDYLSKILYQHQTSWNTAVDEVATMGSELIVALPNDSVNDAINIMIDRNIAHLPVVDEGGEAIGLLSMRDLAQELQSNMSVAKPKFITDFSEPFDFPETLVEAEEDFNNRLPNKFDLVRVETPKMQTKLEFSEAADYPEGVYSIPESRKSIPLTFSESATFPEDVHTVPPFDSKVRDMRLRSAEFSEPMDYPESVHSIPRFDAESHQMMLKGIVFSESADYPEDIHSATPFNESHHRRMLQEINFSESCDFPEERLEEAQQIANL